jgi:hypothetical protein
MHIFILFTSKTRKKTEIFSNCKTITNFFKKHDSLLAIYCHIPGDLIHEISINRHNWDSKKLYVKVFTK